MIHNRSFVPMNPDKKEINELEHSPFDFIANEGNIHSYAASLIPSHWHRELEIFILLEGRVRIGAGSETFEVVPGEGCFINTGILHSFACLVPSPCRYRSFVFDAGIVSGTPGSIFDTRYIRPLLENGPAYLKFEHPAFFRDFDAAFSACANEETGYEFEVRAGCFPDAAPHRPAVGNASPQPTFLPSGHPGQTAAALDRRQSRA